MSEKEKLQNLIDQKVKEVASLEAQATAAQAFWMGMLERDINRRDGSQRQEALHEESMRDARNRSEAAIAALERARRQLSDLRAALASK